MLMLGSPQRWLTLARAVALSVALSPSLPTTMNESNRQLNGPGLGGKRFSPPGPNPGYYIGAAEQLPLLCVGREEMTAHQ